jgi:hypothetical protein
MALPRLTLSAFLLTLLAGAAAAQAPLGPEFRVNDFTTGDQRYPNVAADAVGNFVVVWTTDGQDGSGAGVFARRFDASGAPRGAEFQVNTFTTGDQGFPAVASDAAGNFVVVWESSGQDGDSIGVVGRRFGADGAPTTPEFVVNTETQSYQAAADVAFLSNGGFVVTWMSYAQDGDYTGVYAQRYDAAATRDGPEFQVNTFTTSYQFFASVAALPADGFVVAWESEDQDAPGSVGVYAQRYDAAGPVGTEFRVNGATAGDQFSASVAADSRGAFTVAWAGPDAGGFGIWRQRYDPAGAPLGGEMAINTFTTGTQTTPVIATDANGNLNLAWISSGQDGNSLAVAGNRLDCDGQVLGPDFVANTFTIGAQSQPSVASSSGDFVVAWTSAAQDGSGDGVYARLFRGAPACGRFHALEPCRLADTRLPDGPSGGPPLAAGTARDFPVGGLCGIPADARAVAVNITTTGQTEPGNLRLYPSGEPVPLASAINFTAQHARANNALVRLGAGGQVGVRCDMGAGSTGRTHFILDVFGYFR